MVGIIPKPIKKTSRWHDLAFPISLGLLIAVVLGYFLLWYLESKTKNNLQVLQEQITKIGTQEEKDTERQVLLDKKTIDDFSKLLANHKTASDFFKFLEENCHPKIWVTKLELNPQTAQASLSGTTLNFQTLEQQMTIFENHDLVKKIDLSSLAIGKKGEVEFSFSLDLDPKVFDFDSHE